MVERTADERLRVFFATSEVYPLVKVGGLADVASALPKALAQRGHDMRLFLPRFAGLPAGEPVQRLRVDAGRAAETFDVAYQGVYDRVHYYTVGLADGRHWDPPEGYVEKDLASYVLFSRAVAELAVHPRWGADAVHCNDWHVGHLPAYLRTITGAGRRCRSVMTIHNLAYQGLFTGEQATELGLARYGTGNLLAQGIEHADLVTTVSEQYRDETRTARHGAGLHDVLCSRGDDYLGVLNGVDYDEFDPATDPHLVERYDADHLDGKAANKRHLQAISGLRPDPERPLFAFVARLVGQKGTDLLIEALDEIEQLDVDLVVLGRGEDYETTVRRAARFHPWLSYVEDGSEKDARLAYAGSDAFLAPSRYEPCGLAPLIALRYGSVPVVRRTGGMADTICGSRGTLGFAFDECTATGLVTAMQEALAAYRLPDRWAALRRRGMRAEFRWDTAAQQYEDLYRLAVRRSARTERADHATHA
jgi:starch synthase